MSVHFHFLLEAAKPYAFGDEHTDREGRDGHHHGVGQEIEEIQERHSDDSDKGKRSVAEAGERSESDHDHSHECGALCAAPLKLVADGGDSCFSQRDGACERRKQNQSEEQHAYDAADSHTREDLGHCDEHERGTCAQLLRIAARECEHGGDDHHAGQNSDACVEDLDLYG